jgi:Ca2+-binding EF-hand superfamily protein
MSISSINTTVVSGGSGFNPSKMASKMAEKMMSDLDPNNTGKVTKDQFMSGLTAKGVSSADATKMYNSIDTKGTGSITKSDIETAIKNGNLKPPSGGPQGGTRGAGAPGGAGGASSSSKNYDAADTNKDGVVSAQEALIYAMKQSTASTTENTKTDPSKLGNNVDKQV